MAGDEGTEARRLELETVLWVNALRRHLRAGEASRVAEELAAGVAAEALGASEVAGGELERLHQALAIHEALRHPRLAPFVLAQVFAERLRAGAAPAAPAQPSPRALQTMERALAIRHLLRSSQGARVAAIAAAERRNGAATHEQTPLPERALPSGSPQSPGGPTRLPGRFARRGWRLG